MKPKIFIMIFLLLFFGVFLSAMACDPGDPGCEQWDSGGHIDGGQWQVQDHHNFSFGPNGMGSGDCQDQAQWAHGGGGDGFYGTIDMSQSQFDTYDFSIDNTNHWGSLFQDERIWGSVNPDCDLSISTHQNQGGGSVTDHSDNSMFGCQHANAGISAHLEGVPGTVGVDIFQGQTHGYYHENGSSWQGGQITTTTHLKHGTSPSTP